MTRPRDTQRQKVYGSEAWPGRSAAAERFLVNGETVPSTGNLSIAACQAYVDHLTTAAWFQRRWGRRKIDVRLKTNGSATGGHGAINLPPWAREENTILHEVAHCLTPSSYAAHGPEFVGVLMTLVRHQVGAEAAAEFKKRLRSNRARMTLKAVPEPVREVVTREAMAAKRRAVETRPLGRETATETADRISRAVKAGQMGPVGSAGREAALATARALRKVGA